MNGENRLKKLFARLTYRVSFFYFLRKIQNKQSFASHFFSLLYYKLHPELSGEYQALVKIFNKKFRVRDLTDLLVIKETFSDECYKTLFTDLKEPTTLLDLGSFIGDTAIYAQRYKKVKKVISVEPDTRNVNILKQNLELNKAHNTTLITAAISGKSGSAYFNMGTEGIASSLQKPKKTLQRVKVPTVTLHEIMKNIKTPCIIMKSDCEGAEYEFIMKSSLSTLSRFHKIIFEYHMSKTKLSKVVSKLDRAGFTTECKDLILEPNVGMAYSVKKV